MKSLLVALAILGVVGTVSPMAEARRPEVVRTHRNAHHFDHTELELPDLNNPKGSMTMSCTTCSEVVGDIWEQLHPQILLESSTTSSRPARKSAFIDVVDRACLNLDNKYGLAIDDRTGKATYSMTGDASVERLRGQWVNKYVRKECARVVRASHERIVHHINEFKNEADFVTKVCVDWTKSCPLIKQKPTHPALAHRAPTL